MKEMKRKLVACLMGITVFAALVFAGCGGSTPGLPEGFDETEVETKAMEAVELFNDHNYQGIIDMGSQEMKDSITAEEFAQAGDPYLEKCKAFDKIEKTVFLGNKSKDSKKTFGGVVMIGKYKEGNIQFTISFDEDMNMVQFNIK